MKLVIPARLSYAHVWEPYSFDPTQEPKFSAQLIIPKTSTEVVEKIKTAISEVLIERWPDVKKRPAVLHDPLRDGDVEDRPEVKNSWFLNARSSNAPGIVDAKLQKILDKEEVYSGCFANVAISLFAFDTAGNRGVGVGLNHIQKVKDGPSLEGRGRAEDVFEEISDVAAGL